MKLVIACAIALTTALPGCGRREMPRIATVTEDPGDTLLPGMAPVEGDKMSEAPKAVPGLWKVSITRDGKNFGGETSCEREPRSVLTLMNRFGHPAECSKRTFKKNSAESFTYTGTCKMFEGAYNMTPRIMGKITDGYTLDLSRTKTSPTRGMSFENIRVVALRTGDC